VGVVGGWGGGAGGGGGGGWGAGGGGGVVGGEGGGWGGGGGEGVPCQRLGGSLGGGGDACVDRHDGPNERRQIGAHRLRRFVAVHGVNRECRVGRSGVPSLRAPARPGPFCRGDAGLEGPRAEFWIAADRARGNDMRPAPVQVCAHRAQRGRPRPEPRAVVLRNTDMTGAAPAPRYRKRTLARDCAT